MKGIAIVAAAAALLGLAGCNRVMPLSNASANAAAGNSAAPKPADGSAGNQTATQTADAGKLNAGGGAIPATSTSSNSPPVDRTFILGRWTDDGNCDKAVAFGQDGRFLNPDGVTGLWNLDGDQLTLTGNRTMHFRIRPIDQNTMTVINEDGSLGHSTRC